jgi:hypothetical protein
VWGGGNFFNTTTGGIPDDCVAADHVRAHDLVRLPLLTAGPGAAGVRQGRDASVR